MKLDPTFVSITYGAGGSTQDQSFDLLDFLQNRIGLTCMAHYTCVNASREKVESDLEKLYNCNIKNLMLLRGDIPKDQPDFYEKQPEFRYASDLVKVAKDQSRFTIGVAGYPEKHPESGSQDRDIQYLKYKLDQGGDFIVTQFFFDNNFYYRYVEKARSEGIKERIIPGVIPIINYKQIKKFVQLSHATIPEEVREALEPYQDNPKKTYDIGIEIAIKQCTDLLEHGAPGIHFYTLNKSQATVEIFESIPTHLKSNIRKTEMI